MANGHGGKRAGSGNKSGSVRQTTINKEMAREALRTIVLREMDALVSAQIANAKGLQYLVRRDRSTGKFVKVTGEDFDAIDQDETPLELWQAQPNVQAFTDLMNRALDKPVEAVQHEHKGQITVKWKG